MTNIKHYHLYKTKDRGLVPAVEGQIILAGEPLIVSGKDPILAGDYYFDGFNTILCLSKEEDLSGCVKILVFKDGIPESIADKIGAVVIFECGEYEQDEIEVKYQNEFTWGGYVLTDEKGKIKVLSVESPVK